MHQVRLQLTRAADYFRKRREQAYSCCLQLYDLQFPRALQALRAPELRRVCLEGNSRLSRQNDAAREDKGYRALPVKAADLAWLLHHPRLQTVSITATKVMSPHPGITGRLPFVRA